MDEQILSPFDQWALLVNITSEEYDKCKAAWFAALQWAALDQLPDAWRSDEETPRYCSMKTKNSTLFKAAAASFTIPLYRHAHFAGKTNV